MMEQPEKNLLNASCFFLLEVTADSDDAGADPFDLCSVHRQTEEDAESCSYDEVAVSDDSEVNSLKKIGDFMEDDDDYDDDDDDDDEGEDEACGNRSIGKIWREGDVNQYSGSEMQKSCLSGDSGVEMDEMEKSRRFWEHCLAT